jgi:MOSC domain-containing protein YiiM
MPATLGAFGENLTTRGVLEKDLNIGDQVRIGTALPQVSQPRMPCYKLLAVSRRSGFYRDRRRRNEGRRRNRNREAG